MNQTIITLAKDADLESLPNGAPQIYWTNPSTWGLCAGAAGVRLQATILQVTSAPVTGTPDTSLRIIGQWSPDGRSWTDLLGSLDGSSGPQALNPASLGGLFQNQYAGAPYEMAPFVRFGIEVSREGGRQGRVRASADIVVLDTIAASVTQFATSTDDSGEVTADNDILGPNIVTWAYDRGQLCVRSATFVNLDDVILTVETSFSDAYDDDRLWVTCGILTFDGADQVQQLALADLNVLTRVRCTTFTPTTPPTPTPTATFDAFITLRPAP